MLARIALVAALVAVSGCSKDEKPACTPGGTSNCGGGQVCEVVTGTTGGKCFDPLVVRGRIFGLADDANVAGARVTPLDVDGAPAASTATSASTGAYSLGVAAERNADGSPVAASVTLRVDAAGYQSFPSGLRLALPVALEGATHDAGAGSWIVDNALTDVGLMALASAPAGQIHGTAAVPSGGGSILVVADCGGVGHSAIASSNGAYRIFNVPDGACRVRGYTEGKNYAPVDVTVASGSDETANLALSATLAATVSGGLQYVAGADTNPTSVLLVVDATFDPATLRGTAPAGLRAGAIPVNGDWSIPGVPDGRYRVLAAFETDYLLRDPADPILVLEVVDGLVYQVNGLDLTPWVGTEKFKITGALKLMSPILAPTPSTSDDCAEVDPLPAYPDSLREGQCVSTTASPAIRWGGYSVEYFDVRVIDHLGTTVWNAQVDKTMNAVAYGQEGVGITTLVPAVSLVSGGIYQVRVEGVNLVKDPVTDLYVPVVEAATEDLLGVFRYGAP